MLVRCGDEFDLGRDHVLAVEAATASSARMRRQRDQARGEITPKQAAQVTKRASELIARRH